MINSIIYPYGDFSHSSSYKYLIKGNNLHRLNDSQPDHVFEAVYTNMNPDYTCKVEEDGIKVLAVCYQFVTTPPLMNILVLMWVDTQPFTLLTERFWTQDAVSSPVNVKFSPKLTKIYLDFYHSNMTLTSIVRGINFETRNVSLITFANESRYIQTINSLNRNLDSKAFYFGDNHMAVRNDTYENSYGRYVE